MSKAIPHLRQPEWSFELLHQGCIATAGRDVTEYRVLLAGVTSRLHAKPLDDRCRLKASMTVPLSSPKRGRHPKMSGSVEGSPACLTLEAGCAVLQSSRFT